tara:strand:+ start:1110 stop:1739 length:630 start_codon:yes stop_codon:yes gene_type:complete
MSSSNKRPPPTKLELIKLKRSLVVAKSVYKILEDKRDVLLKRIEEMIDEAGQARTDMSEPLSDAYRSLFNAYLTLGSNKLESIAHTTPSHLDIDVNVKVIVDVRIPSFTINEKKLCLNYGFADSNSNLDQATKMMRLVLPRILKAAEYENTILGLARGLEKTQRLINALEYVIMPDYQESIKFISSILEEREREDFARLKHVKKVIQSR